MTGQDMMDAMEAIYNHRGNFDRDCSFCVHDGVEADFDEFCDGCSVSDTDKCCSCHINPPCGYCVNSLFEVSPYLINFEHHKDGKKRWQCFRGTKEVFDKLTLIENVNWKVSVEILTTNEVAMYIDDGFDFGSSVRDEAIEVCQRKEYRQVMCKMIMDFKI